MERTLRRPLHRTAFPISSFFRVSSSRTTPEGNTISLVTGAPCSTTRWSGRGPRRKRFERPNWIIDVRDNVGGNDSTYRSLLPWLLSGEIRAISQDWLVTEENIHAHGRVCDELAPDDPSCAATIEQIVGLLRDAEKGDYIAVDGRDVDGIAYHRVDPHPNQPRRVAILVDDRCGSACENFLLSTRQSFAVKLVGRASYGALDYSNMRSIALPSGNRALWYATTRSSLLPQYSVDESGIAPDIHLPRPEEDAGRQQEVIRVQRWLEEGILSTSP